MARNYIQAGDRIPHIATAAIASGAVVALGGVLTVALADAAVGQSVEVATRGVWRLPKTAGTAINQGDALYWDVSAGAFAKAGAPAAGDITGAAWAAAPAAAAATTVEIYLAGAAGVVVA